MRAQSRIWKADEVTGNRGFLGGNRIPGTGMVWLWLLHGRTVLSAQLWVVFAALPHAPPLSLHSDWLDCDGTGQSRMTLKFLAKGH